MVGTKDDPGLMVLSLNAVFDLIKRDKRSDEFEVTCSYLEVYNEVCLRGLLVWQSYVWVTFCLTELFISFFKTIFQVIYDLLEKSSGHLELREDPEQGITVAGLRCIKVRSFCNIMRSSKSEYNGIYWFSLINGKFKFVSEKKKNIVPGNSVPFQPNQYCGRSWHHMKPL